jgi:hypothetical protein
MKKYTDKQLTKKLDEVVRELLHIKTTTKKCFVCNRYTDWFHPKTNPHGLQVGHYVSRSVFALRWDLLNCEPVCSGCNRIHEENTLPHTMALVKAYGKERLDYLNEKFMASKLKTKTFTYGEKLELYEKLQEELANLQSVCYTPTL